MTDWALFVKHRPVQVRTREEDNGRKHKADEGCETALGVMGRAGQLSDECSCGHVDLLLCSAALLAMSADVAFVGG